MSNLIVPNGFRVWWYVTAGVPSELTQDQVAQLFSDTVTEEVAGMRAYNNTLTVAVVFPELYDITDVWWAARNTNTSETSTPSCQYSTDATGPDDGTWSTAFTPTKSNPVAGGAAQAWAQAGVKALRWNCGTWSNTACYMQAVFLYGTRTAPSTLGLIETATTDEVTGDDLSPATLTRGSVDTTKSFRVRNYGATQANGVRVASQVNPYDALAGDDLGVAFSDDGGATWKGQLAVGDIPAGSQSGQIDMKITAYSDEPTGVYRPQIVLDADSWS